ncbi:MAG: hypothetical protein NW208_10125 [Bryobacter sp.]|nr:hypothetical protein [Bryobacter sp.]
MQRILLAALLVGATCACAQDKKDTKTEVKKITDANELEKLLKEESNRFFLDVREPAEISELGGSLPGYVNIPLGELEKRMNEVPKDKTIITA